MKNAFRFLVLAAAAILALDPATAAPPPNYGTAPPSYGAADYRLGVNDKIKVIVQDEPDLGGDFQVDATGFVRIPVIGQIKAGGLTARDLEAAIRAQLAQGYLNDPRVAVEITAFRPFYVTGEVLKPGEYPFQNGMTASTAVALAGGYSQKAVQSTILIRHQGEVSPQRYALNQPLPIYPGDEIRVDSTMFWDVLDVLAPISGISALRYSLQ